MGARQLTQSSPRGARRGREKRGAASPHTLKLSAATQRSLRRYCAGDGAQDLDQLQSRWPLGAGHSGARRNGARLDRARRGRAHVGGVQNTRAARCGAPMTRQRPPRARRIRRRDARRYGVGRRGRFVDTCLQRYALTPSSAHAERSPHAASERSPAWDDSAHTPCQQPTA